MGIRYGIINNILNTIFIGEKNGAYTLFLNILKHNL